DIAYSWTSEPKDANMGFSVGLTKRLFYPLWIYVGGGVSQDNLIFQYDANEEDKWGYYPDDYKINPLGEGGLILKLWILHISGGVRSNFKTFYPTFGAGFAF
ncbi:MAG: hypothetical protein LBN11_02270, partial [Tannerella sp.]|nr:hypothetical protein [Tannerella sp.]